jgi:hypothetical protein
MWQSCGCELQPGTLPHPAGPTCFTVTQGPTLGCVAPAGQQHVHSQQHHVHEAIRSSRIVYPTTYNPQSYSPCPSLVIHAVNTHHTHHSSLLPCPSATPPSPVALSFAWLAYGLWAAWPNVIFLMLVTVALTATLLPAGTLVGLVRPPVLPTPPTRTIPAAVSFIL